MTRAEILDCLTDRPCDSCKFHESGRCERWNCVFEEKPHDEKPIPSFLIHPKNWREIGCAYAVIVDGKTVHIPATICSNCQKFVIDSFLKVNYCPNCGARMEVSENG